MTARPLYRPLVGKTRRLKVYTTKSYIQYKFSSKIVFCENEYAPVFMPKVSYLFRLESTVHFIGWDSEFL